VRIPARTSRSASSFLRKTPTEEDARAGEVEREPALARDCLRGGGETAARRRVAVVEMDERPVYERVRPCQLIAFRFGEAESGGGVGDGIVVPSQEDQRDGHPAMGLHQDDDGAKVERLGGLPGRGDGALGAPHRLGIAALMEHRAG
jgi:hypothetical protein